MTNRILYLILFITWSASAQAFVWLQGPYLDFIKADRQNSYIAPDSDITNTYLAQSAEIFKVPYLFVPEDVLQLELSDVHSDQIKNHLIVEREGKRYVRFFIHPESTELYQPLINKYGIAGHYEAVATSSARTVLAADPERENLPPVFLKLSIAKVHDRMGRIIPAWEVRRGVRNTQQLLASGEMDELSNVHIIPEFAGVYVRADSELPFYVDEEQGTVSEHGFILRDATFLEKYSSEKIVPLFSLFSSTNDKAPPIIQYWQKARKTQPRLSFNKYFQETILRPFIKLNMPLMLKHGVFPQIHGQNVLISLNPRTKKLKRAFHRDIGSFKTDYRLRWIHNLSVDKLRSPLADKDFGLSWGAEQYWDNYDKYFFEWNFFTYFDDMASFYSKYDLDKIRLMIRETLAEETKLYLHNESNAGPTENLIFWIDQNRPENLQVELDFQLNGKDLDKWLLNREADKQVVRVPKGWQKDLRAWLGKQTGIATPYGYIFRKNSKARVIYIAFYEGDEFSDNEIDACSRLFRRPPQKSN